MKNIKLLCILFYFVPFVNFAQVVIDAAATPSTCLNNGTIELTITGVSQPITYGIVKSPYNVADIKSSTLPLFTGLEPGDYFYGYFDGATFIKASTTINIENKHITISPSFSSYGPRYYAYCGATDPLGEIFASVTGGNKPYTIELLDSNNSTVQETQTSGSFWFTGLVAGNYRLKATDACGTVVFAPNSVSLKPNVPYTNFSLGGVSTQPSTSFFDVVYSVAGDACSPILSANIKNVSYILGLAISDVTTSLVTDKPQFYGTKEPIYKIEIQNASGGFDVYDNLTYSQANSNTFTLPTDRSKWGLVRGSVTLCGITKTNQLDLRQYNGFKVTPLTKVGITIYDDSTPASCTGAAQVEVWTNLYESGGCQPITLDVTEKGTSNTQHYELPFNFVFKLAIGKTYSIVIKDVNGNELPNYFFRNSTTSPSSKPSQSDPNNLYIDPAYFTPLAIKDKITFADGPSAKNIRKSALVINGITTTLGLVAPVIIESISGPSTIYRRLTPTNSTHFVGLGNDLVPGKYKIKVTDAKCFNAEYDVNLESYFESITLQNVTSEPSTVSCDRYIKKGEIKVVAVGKSLGGNPDIMGIVYGYESVYPRLLNAPAGAVNFMAATSGSSTLLNGNALIRFSFTEDLPGNYEIALSRKMEFKLLLPADVFENTSTVPLNIVPDFPAFDLTQSGGVICPGSTTGSLTVKVDNAMGALTYFIKKDTDTNYPTTGQSMPTFAGLVAGNYVIKAKSSCYEVVQPFTLKPAVQIGNIIEGDNVYCTGGSLKLATIDLGPVASITWTLPNNTTVNSSRLLIDNVTIANKGEYKVRVVTLSGCTFDGTITVNVADVVEVDAPIFSAQSAPLVCQSIDPQSGDYSAVSANATGITYSLSPPEAGVIGKGSNPSLVEWNPSFYGKATITATAIATSCGTNKSTDFAVTVTSRSKPVDIIADDRTICSGETDIVLNASTLTIANPVFSWYDNNTASGVVLGTGANFTVSPSVTTTYYVGVAGDNFCINDAGNRKAVTVTVRSNVTLVGTPSTACAVDGSGYVVTLNVSGEAPYTATGSGAPGTWSGATWTSGAIPAGIDYKVNIKDAYACNTLVVEEVAPVCCQFDVICPTFPTTTVACYNQLPAAISLTKAEFEALGNGDGIIGAIPCGVIAITASNGVDPGCNANATRTYTVTEYADPNNNKIRDTGEDIVLNTSTCVQIITIDRVDFVLPANEGSTVACAASITTPTVPEITDSCGTILTPSIPVISTAPACNGDVTYTYTFTDCKGNTHDWVYTYTIDRADFVLPANEGSTVACAASITTPTVPEITDSCGTILTPSIPVISTAPACNGDVTYTYTFTDCKGNTHDWVYTYTVDRVDFVLPANEGSTVACAASITTPTVPEITDSCGTILTPSIPVISTAPACNGDVTYTYTFTDCKGNTHDWVYMYTINRADFVLPVNEGSTVACAASITAPTVPVVTDNCGTILTPSAPVISAVPVCNGDVTYTYTFTDCKGNTHDWVYTYTINRADFVLPANEGSTVACATSITAPTVPVVTDNCGTVLTPSAPVTSTAPVCNGDVTYTYTFTDCKGNTHDWVYTYTINRANFVLPANEGSTVACAASITTPTVPEITDSCGTILTPSIPVIAAAPACNGDVTYTYTFTDCKGNTHDWVYTYTIDRADFVLPANEGSTVACAASITTPTVPVVTDSCGTVLTPSIPVISTAPACNGDVTYTYTFTDCKGNTHDWVYTYTIENVAAPTGIIPANLTLQCLADIPIANINAVTNTKSNCNGTVAVKVADTNNGGTGCVGNPYIVSRRYTLTDCGGLTTNLVQTITVADTTAPVFVEALPRDMTVDCLAPIPTAATLTAIGNCSNATVNYIETRINESCAKNYQLKRTWTAVDACGNEVIHTQIITIKDTTAPIFVEPLPPAVIEVNCASIAPAVTLTATAICGTATVDYTETRVDGDCSSRYSLIRTWTANDGCGNSSTHTQTVYVSCLADIFNALSPNGDGMNDTLKIEGINCYPDNNVKIFNRYGVLVYEKKNYDNVTNPFQGISDGRATMGKGDQLPSGTYFYILEYDDNGRRVEKSGYLYISD